MAVLVVGGAGYVGSHAVRALVATGRRAVILDDLSTGHRAACPAGVTLHVGTLEDRALVGKILDEERIDAVMHFAARSLVGESTQNPRAYFEANCAGSIALVGTMLDHGVATLVFSSSAAVFGDPGPSPLEDAHPRRPSNPYGVTKALIEDLLTAYRVHGLRSVALRYFNAAGADPSGEIGEHHAHETHLIPLVLDAALGVRPAIEVFGTDYPTRDGTALRDYVHVSDLAAAHLAALSYLEGGGEPLRTNLGSGTGTTVREVIAAVERVTDRRVPTVDAPRRAGDPAILVASSAAAERILGWRAVRPEIDTIVADAWRWHQRLRSAT